MPERKIWDFECFTICRLLGLAFDDAEMAKIFKRLKIGCAGSSSHDMHHGLIRICMTENPASKFVNKLLKERFGKYRDKLYGFDAKEIIGIIERSDGSIDVPLPVLIWFAVINPREDMDEIERERSFIPYIQESTKP